MKLQSKNQQYDNSDPCVRSELTLVNPDVRSILSSMINELEKEYQQVRPSLPLKYHIVNAVKQDEAVQVVEKLVTSITAFYSTPFLSSCLFVKSSLLMKNLFFLTTHCLLTDVTLICQS